MKKRDLLSRLVTPTGTKGCASATGTKEELLSRTGVPGWETGTTGVSQPGQINVFVVVVPLTFACGVNFFSSMLVSRFEKILHDDPLHSIINWTCWFQTEAERRRKGLASHSFCFSLSIKDRIQG